MIKIVVDSGCDLSTDKLNNNISVEQVPLTLQLENKVYIDDTNLDIGEYLSAMKSCPTVPKTAAPSPEHFLEKFKGLESIFAVTLSSYLSGSYNSAMAAKQMYIEEIGQKFIHVFDSLSASVGEAQIALKISEFAAKNLTDNEIVESINQFIKNMKTFFLLENFDNIVKTGRMNPYVAKLASVLSIKPICGGVDGKMVLLNQARGFKKAAQKLIDMMLKENLNFEERILAISHVKCPDKAIEFKEEALKRINFKDAFIVEAGGLVATYANKDGLVISY